VFQAANRGRSVSGERNSVVSATRAREVCELAVYEFWEGGGLQPTHAGAAGSEAESVGRVAGVRRFGQAGSEGRIGSCDGELRSERRSGRAECEQSEHESGHEVQCDEGGVASVADSGEAAGDREESSEQ